MTDYEIARASVVVDYDSPGVAAALARDEAAFRGLTNESRRTTKHASLMGSVMGQQKRNLQALGTAAKYAAAGGVAALGYALYDTVKAGAAYQQEMSRVQAVSGATGRQMGKLGDLSLKLGAKTKFSASEAAAAMYELSSAGFKVGEMTKTIGGTLDLAAASNIDLASAAEISANALRGFGLDASKSQKVADVLAQSVNSSSVEMTDLQLTMKYIGPVAKATGQSFETMIAAVGEMGDAGIKGEQAGTTLRQSLLSLTKPVGQAVDGLRMLGLSTTDLQGPKGLDPLPKIIAQIEHGMEGLSRSEQNAALKMIFGQEAASGMFAVISQGPEKLRELTKELRNSEGAAEKAARTMQDNVAGAWENFMGSVETTQITLFQEFEKPLQDTIEDATRFVNKKGPELTAAIGSIVDTPDFRRADLEGKLSIIAEALWGVTEDAMPKVAELMGKAAAHGAEAYVKGFAESNVWGKAALGALLVSKLGVGGYLFQKPGAMAAESLVGSMGASMAGGAAAQRFQQMGRTFEKSASGLVVPAGTSAGAQAGEAMATQTGASFKSRLLRGGLLVGGVMGAMEALGTRGGVLDTIEGNGTAWGEVTGEAFVAKYGAVIADGLKRAARGQSVDLGGGVVLNTPEDFSGAADDLRAFKSQLEAIDGLPPELAAQLEEYIATVEKSGRASQAYSKVVDANFRAMRKGVFNSLGDIDKAVEENSDKIAAKWPKGSEGARQELAKTYRLAADNVDKLVDRQVISVEQGERRKAELIRRSKVVNASEDSARKFGEAWAKGMTKSEDFTGKGVKGIMRELRQMPDDARQVAADTWLGQLRVAAQKNPKLQDEFRDLQSKVASDLNLMRRKGTRATASMMSDIVDNFVSGARGVKDAEENIRDNTNKALGSFGAKEQKFTLKNAKNIVGGGMKAAGYQTGGLAGIVPGAAAGDNHVLSLNGEPIARVESQEGIFVGNRTLMDHMAAANAAVPRRQQGGPVPLPGFASGGAVGDTGGLQPGILQLAALMHNKFGMTVTSGLRAGDSGSMHSRGVAADFAGGNFTGAAAYMNSIGPSLAEGIYNGALGGPNVSWDSGARVSPSFWGSDTWADHGDHIHAAKTAMGALKGFATEIARVLLQGPNGPIKQGGQGAIDDAWKAAKAYLESKMPTVGVEGSGMVSGDGDVEQVFADVARKLSNSRTATLALGEAGYAESGMQDLAGGDASSEGALQLLASTAAGMGINPHDEGAVASAFLTRGYYGKGGANSLAAKGLPAHTVAQYVQGSGAGQPLGIQNYLPQKGNAENWMKRFGLQQGGLVGKFKGGGLVGRIEDLYGKLVGTDGAKERRKIERRIRDAQRRLKRQQSKQRHHKLDRIKKQGAMKGMREEVDKRQLAADTLADYIGRLETQHGFTEQRDVSTILEEMGLDPDAELSTLTADQRGVLEGAVNSDAGVEETERNSEIGLNYQRLQALLSLRQQLLVAIEEAEARIKKAEAQIKRAGEEEKKAEKQARKIEHDLKQLQRQREKLRKDEPPKKNKGESAKDFQQRLKKWKEHRAERMVRIGDKIATGRFALGQANTAAGLAAGTQEAAKGVRSSLIDTSGEFSSSLEGVQGLGSSMDPNVKMVWPSGAGPAQFGGEILLVQDKLQTLGATKVLRPDLDYSTGGGDSGGSGGPDASELLQLKLDQAMDTIRRQNVGIAQNAVFQGAFAEGGFVPGPGYFLAGEEGPELVKSRGGEYVHTADETAGLLGGGGGDAVQIGVVINGHVIANGSGKDLVELVVGDRRFPVAVKDSLVGAGRGLYGDAGTIGVGR